MSFQIRPGQPIKIAGCELTGSAVVEAVGVSGSMSGRIVGWRNACGAAEGAWR